jgi:RNA polymerase sigma-70 factor, ECF subfamily
VDRLRKHKREIDIVDLIVPTDERQLVDATQNQTTGRLRLFLEEMPEKLRVTLELAYLQGLTHSEISQRTGDSLGTTKSGIGLALSWIRKRLDCNSADGNGHVS